MPTWPLLLLLLEVKTSGRVLDRLGLLANSPLWKSLVLSRARPLDLAWRPCPTKDLGGLGGFGGAGAFSDIFSSRSQHLLRLPSVDDMSLWRHMNNNAKCNDTQQTRTKRRTLKSSGEKSTASPIDFMELFKRSSTWEGNSQQKPLSLIGKLIASLVATRWITAAWKSSSFPGAFYQTCNSGKWYR